MKTTLFSAVQSRWSAGGDRLKDTTARLWDAASGKPIGGPMKHEESLIRHSSVPMVNGW